MSFPRLRFPVRRITRVAISVASELDYHLCTRLSRIIGVCRGLGSFGDPSPPTSING